MDKNKHFTIPEILIQLKQMDIPIIVKILAPVIVYYISTNIINRKNLKYQINKSYTPKDISKVTIPPEVKQEYSNINIDEIISMQWGKYVLRFADFLIENFPEECLVNFYNNINNLDVISEELTYKKYSAGYNVVENQIIVDENIQLFSTITKIPVSLIVDHELFHMASSLFTDETVYSGFSQESPTHEIIGNGINEGYTQLLTERYMVSINRYGFEYNTPEERPYFFERNITEKLEEIIGRDIMEKLYFKADLNGLINELKQYSDEDEISNFISKTDYISQYLGSIGKRKKLYDSKKISESFSFVYGFLLDTYSKKMIKDYEDNLISEEEYIKNITEYGNSLMNIFNIKRNISYDEDFYKDKLDSIFENYSLGKTL